MAVGEREGTFRPVTARVRRVVPGQDGLALVAVAPLVRLDPPVLGLSRIELEPVDLELADLGVVGHVRAVLVVGPLVDLDSAVRAIRRAVIAGASATSVAVVVVLLAVVAVVPLVLVVTARLTGWRPIAIPIPWIGVRGHTRGDQEGEGRDASDGPDGPAHPAYLRCSSGVQPPAGEAGPAPSSPTQRERSANEWVPVRSQRSRPRLPLRKRALIGTRSAQGCD